MAFSVLLTDAVVRDLEGIWHYIRRNDGRGKAEHVLHQIEEVFQGLSEPPNRGAYPKELLLLGIREYREVFFKPYRILYRVYHNDVFVLLIADGRRDIQILLQQRLLQA